MITELHLLADLLTYPDPATLARVASHSNRDGWTPEAITLLTSLSIAHPCVEARTDFALALWHTIPTDQRPPLDPFTEEGRAAALEIAGIIDRALTHQEDDRDSDTVGDAAR